MLTVPWGSERFVDLAVVAADLEAALEQTPPGRAAKLLSCLLKIARGEWPRPTTYQKIVHRHITSVLMLAGLAGIKKSYLYDDEELVALLDEWLPRLADAPGYPVRLVAGEPVPVNSVLAKVMLALNKAEREDRYIPAAHTHGVSVIGFCEQNGLSIQEVRSHELSVRQITEAGKRPGAINGRYQPLFRGAQYDADVETVLSWLRDLYRQKRPLPSHPERPTLVDFAYIEAEAGLAGRSIRMSKRVNAHISMHRSELGVEPIKRLTAAGPTCADFKRDVRVWFLAEHGQTSLNNMMTALNRVFAARDLTPSSEFPRTLFADPIGLQAEAAAVEPPLRAARNLKRPLEVLADYSRRFCDQPGDDLPKAPHAALDFALSRWGGRMIAAERATGIPSRLLGLMRSGNASLPERYVRCLPALDDLLGTGDGLYRRFEPIATFRLCDCSLLYRSIEPRVRRMLPPGAHRLPDAELLAHVRNVQENLIRQPRMYSKVLSAAQRFWRDIPDLPDDAPVLEEIRQLMLHKTLAVPDDARRRPRGQWRKATRKIYDAYLRHFARFAMLERSRGGLGLPVEDITLGLILNWRIFAAHAEFLSRRYEDVEHDGERRGPLLTVNDLGFMQLAVQLLHPVHGWLVQRTDLFLHKLKAIGGALGPFPALEEIRIRHSGDDELDVEDIEELVSASSKMFRATMPQSLVDKANTDWMEACIDARFKISNLREYLKRLTDPSRHPFEPIQVILDSDKPLNFLRDIAHAAQEDLPNIKLEPVGHAAAVRDLLMFVLLSLTALRSKNLRQLLYDPRDGHVTVHGEQLLIKIPWENFKNLGNNHLFGIDGFKFDYERLLDNWFNVKDLFEHYVRRCRPVLISHYAKALRRTAKVKGLHMDELRQTTKALFPTASLELMDEHEFGHIIRELTRKYHVRDPQTGLLRPGYMFFGPHAVRDILATHIVMSSDEPSRWEAAADLLQTSVAMVMLRYTKRKVIDRLAKSDRHFIEASEGFKAVQFA